MFFQFLKIKNKIISFPFELKINNKLFFFLILKLYLNYIIRAIPFFLKFFTGGDL
jgi:hypothetical protein